MVTGGGRAASATSQALTPRGAQRISATPHFSGRTQRFVISCQRPVTIRKNDLEFLAATELRRIQTGSFMTSAPDIPVTEQPPPVAIDTTPAALQFIHGLLQTAAAEARP